jgi:hypothetical protein
MKQFFLYLLLAFPFFCQAQLFPNVGGFRGNVQKVVEKYYGKEVPSSKKDSGIYKPRKFSGWKETYFLGANSRIVRQVRTFNNKIQSERTYQRTKSAGKIVEREIIRNIGKVNSRTCIEYENFTNAEGLIVKVNQWSVDLKTNKRELFLVETDAEYVQGKLKSFIRHNVSEGGELDKGEKCELVYDAEGRLIRIDRKDLGSELKTVLDYSYNPKGFLDHYSVDLLVGLPVYGKNPKQDIYYKCDKKGNWVKKYRYVNDKKVLEARRTIKYR